MSNPGQPTIRRGSEGEVVKRAQRALRRVPFASLELVVDGIFGPKTEAAVKSFQQNNGLTEDGIVGLETWHHLPGGGPMPVLKEGSVEPAVTGLQGALSFLAGKLLIVDPQGVDGNFGPKTKASVQSFQQHVGLQADGIVGERTWDAHFFVPLPTALETLVGLKFVID